MQIRNKYYPYPVIAYGNDSYDGSEFVSDAKICEFPCDRKVTTEKTSASDYSDFWRNLVGVNLYEYGHSYVGRYLW